MEKNSVFDDQMELPPGFRFHPTDEELITHYLSKKVLDSSFCSIAVGEVDMNKVEPWELPWRAKVGEKEWYFFCVRDKKYPTGLRTNRATPAGYWKATGKDKEIFRGKTLVGMKKTLVFYKGRAPKGEKSNWVNHEYSLEGKFSLYNLPKSAKNDLVISRVFHKTSGGKKVHKNELTPLTLPPPIDDPSRYGGGSRINPGEPGSGHVHCFSNPKNDPENMITCFNNPISFSSSNPVDSFVMASASNPTALSWGQLPPIRVGSGFQIPGSAPMQDQDPSIFRAFLGNHGLSMKDKEMITTSVSQETALSNENSSIVSNFEMRKKPLFEEHEAPSTSVEPQDLECMWSF